MKIEKIDSICIHGKDIISGIKEFDSPDIIITISGIPILLHKGKTELIKKRINIFHVDDKEYEVFLKEVREIINENRGKDFSLNRKKHIKDIPIEKVKNKKVIKFVLDKLKEKS